MKRIAIFCDGTWNNAADDTPTNVVRLRDLLADRDAQGNAQLGFYLPGVGAREDLPTGLARLVDRLGGGAFGWGLVANIEAFYRKIAEAYAPGDAVYIFGFSRGAYTARSLAGLLRTCGIPDAGTRGSIPEAMRVYRERDRGAERGDVSPPDQPRPLRFRADFSPVVATSAYDLGLRLRPEDCTLYRTAYVGVWDTVGALGVPSHLTGLARIFNRRHRFHDTDLSSSVLHARHAVAIDETRRTFPPTLWDNLDGPDGLNARFPPDPGRGPRYRQLWFPGTHGAVGGGGDLDGLSSAALYWIAKGAEGAGLRFVPALEDVVARMDPASPVAGTTGRPGVLGRLLSLGAASRTQLRAPEAVSRLARRRLLLDPAPADWAPPPPTLHPVLAPLRAAGDPGPDPDR